MEGDEAARRGKEALSGGHLCHVCGYQYPNSHPSAKLRRSHRKNCRKMPAAAAAGDGRAGVDDREERNAGEGLLLGEEGSANAASAANGGYASRGSAKKDVDLVEDEEAAEHAPSNGTRVEAITGEPGLINWKNDSVEITNEHSKTIFQRACTDGSQNKVAEHCSEISQLAVGRQAEREDSFDEYQDASPFLHQSDSEEGVATALKSEVSIEDIKNLNNVPLGEKIPANEISLDMNGLCKQHFSGDPCMTDLSADSKVGKVSECYLENRAPGLAEPTMELESSNRCSVNVQSNSTDMLNSKSDNTSGYCEQIGDFNDSALLKCSPLVSDQESPSTCSRKADGCMEDNMALHIMSELSPRSEVVGSGSVESETATNSRTDFVQTESEWAPIHTVNASTGCSSQHKPAEDAPDVHLAIENSCLKNSVCSVDGYQINDPAVTNVDSTCGSTAEGNLVMGAELDFSTEESSQQDDEKISNIAGENPFLEKPNGLSEEEVCTREIGPEVPTKDQVTTCQEHVTVLMDQESVNNPFSLDDTRGDDLFELAAGSYNLEAPNIAEYKRQVDSALRRVDELTMSNQISIAEVQYRVPDNCMLAVPSICENESAAGAEGLSFSSSADPMNNISLHDSSVSHSMQEAKEHTSGISFVQSGVCPAEFSTMPTSQEINALRTDVEKKIPTEDKSREVIASHSMYNVEEKIQTEDAWNAILKADEEEKLTGDIGAQTNAVQQTDDVEKNQADETCPEEANAEESLVNVEEKKQAEDTGATGVSALGSMKHVDATNQTEDTDADKTKTQVYADNKQANDTITKDIDAVQHADAVEEKKQAEDTSAKESNIIVNTYNAEEKTRTEDVVGKDGNNKKEEISVTGSRLNSGRIHVPLKVLLAEASVETKTKEKKPSTKERVLSFTRRASKDDSSSAKSASAKAGADDQYWNSPAKLPDNNVEKRSSKGRKQPWVPFICCHSVH